ncbi:ABC transporter ATPase [Achromatium sp. WMS3]|nr:ABC transporter ATPase [Achromatium sp. WMS3]
MTTLMTLRGIHLAFGDPPLLEAIDLVIKQGEKICLIGRNGTGKSSLLKLIAGQIKPDQGSIESRRGLKVSYLPQTIPQNISSNVFTVVAQGLGDVYELLQQYQSANLALNKDASSTAIEHLTELQQQLDVTNGWQATQRIETIISRLELNPKLPFASLSGGLKRRVLLAQALVSNPDLLLLDEPTNHLDIDSIEWLENFLINFSATLLFVTHDRSFLNQLATKILELDRGQLTEWPGNYTNYLKHREERLHAESKMNARFDKHLAQEEIWIRQGIKARRTRNEGRVRALQHKRQEFKQRRSLEGIAQIKLQDIVRSGRLVIAAENLQYSWEQQVIIQDFASLILRGDKIGILGPNGCGKTTLLNLLLGHLIPEQGQVTLGTNLEIAYFDQQRAQLNETASVRDNIADGSDTVIINGKSIHVLSYLQDFLFSPHRAKQPVVALSGGERNRLLLARLFAKPANLLVMDEPTNDLDIETLELLEDLLLAFQGTLLLVSHDRTFIDNIVTSTLAYQGNGKFVEYVGGYQDWLRQRPAMIKSFMDNKDGSQAKTKSKSSTKSKTNQHAKNKAADTLDTIRKLSFKEQQELTALPTTIEQLESEQLTLQTNLAQPDFYRQESGIISATHQRLKQLEDELQEAYARWEYLE